MTDAISEHLEAAIDRILGVAHKPMPAPTTPDFYAEPCPQCRYTGGHANGCELGDLP